MNFKNVILIIALLSLCLGCVKIKSKEFFNPYMEIDNYGFFSSHTVLDERTFKNPGTYKLQFHYSTISKNINDYIGSSDKLPENDTSHLSKLFLQVPNVEIVSNTIEISIVE